jgi:NAD(P)-dependent dehydrogenase (short-subunit alcohol dehydrogenase family)
MASSMFGLEGKRALVLGGGLGMGEATVRMLAELGCDVAVADIIPERAERVASAVASEWGVKSLPVIVDVTDDAGLVDAIARTEREFGPIDRLATIVGMAAWSPIAEMTLETWDLDHRRNLRYFFVAAREVGRSMLRRNSPGAMVCVVSIDGIRSAPYHASYGAAKAGLVSLVKSMSAEWAEYGIRVNAVAPGAMITPRIPDRGPEIERQSMATVPMRRRGQVQDIAKAATFFLSDLSAYVTGQTLAVDGGFLSVGPLQYQMPQMAPGGTMGQDDGGSGPLPLARP